MSLIEKIKQIPAELVTYAPHSKEGVDSSKTEIIGLIRRSEVLKILEEQQQQTMNDYLEELKEQGFIVTETQKIQELLEWWEIRPKVGDTDKPHYQHEYEAIEEWIGKVERWLRDGEKKFVEVFGEQK